MLITTYQDAEDFLQKVRPILEEDEISNGLLLGAVSDLANPPILTDFYLATVEDEDNLLVAAYMMPPLRLILYSSDATDGAALAALALHLMQENWPVSGVLGPVPASKNFARIWTKLSGQRYREGTHQGVFQSNEIISPVPVPGKLRLATENDIDLVKHWTVAFMEEALHENTVNSARRKAEVRVRAGNVYLWEIPDGCVVSMATKTRPLTTAISVSLVYTPPMYRGMGYASNCVAALSELLLNEGWQYCSLFTDLSNPISNSIYQKMGYEPVCDFDEYVFED